MELPQQLTQLGLTDKQAKIYLALLSIDSGSVMEIANEAGIKRPTAYIVLGELRDKGLVVERKDGKSTKYQAVEPAALGLQLERQLNQYEKIKPFLDSIYKKDGSRPNVQFYSGLSEMKNLYEMFHVEHSKIDFFGTDLQTFRTTLPDVFKMYSGAFGSATHDIREIVTFNEFNFRYARANTSDYHKIRIVKRGIEFFGDNAIYGDTVMIAGFKDPFAVTIQSKDIVRTFRSLFELAWGAATPARALPQATPTNNVPRGTLE